MIIWITTHTLYQKKQEKVFSRYERQQKHYHKVNTFHQTIELHSVCLFWHFRNEEYAIHCHTYLYKQRELQ